MAQVWCREKASCAATDPALGDSYHTPGPERIGVTAPSTTSTGCLSLGRSDAADHPSPAKGNQGVDVARFSTARSHMRRMIALAG
jgi:hypothetical protein